MFNALIKSKGGTVKLQIPNLLTMVNNAISFMGNANVAVNTFCRETIKPELETITKDSAREIFPLLLSYSKMS